MLEGYLGLFLSAFLAATLVPFSSEALLAGLQASGEFDLVWLFAAAAAGNTLGSAANWLLGRFCLHWQDRRWFPFSPEQLARAADRFRHYGMWSLLFAWLPVVGDPLTFAAGVLRAPFWLFLLLVGIGKAGRYAVLIFAVWGVTG